jgi:hypothetical protein
VIYLCFANDGNILEIEAKLGIVNQSLKEVTFTSDAMKKPVQSLSKEARDLIKKLQSDKKAREDYRRNLDKLKTLQIEQDIIERQKYMQEEKKVRDE